MIVLAFDDNKAASKLPSSIIKKLNSVGWRQIGVADHTALGEIIFDGESEHLDEVKTTLTDWVERSGRSATLNDEEMSETSSLEKPDVKTDDIIDSKILLKRQIGRGQFATVWSGTTDDTPCAIKLFTTDEDYAEIVQREIDAMNTIGEHNNVVRMIMHGHDAEHNCGYIVFERMTCDLFSALRQRGAMPLSTALRAFASVMKGLQHVHSLDIAHADVKPENVLCDPQGRVCLSDFGGSLRVDDKGLCGGEESIHVTTEYRAPEVILDEEYYLKSDIWSAAALLYEICTAEPLFPVDDESDDEDEDEDEEEKDEEEKDEEEKDEEEKDEEEKDEGDKVGGDKAGDDKVEGDKGDDENDENTAQSEAKSETADLKPDAKAEIFSENTSLIQVDVPILIDDSIPGAPDSDDEDDSDFDLNEALDELTEHQKKVTQLACMVRVLGPVPKAMAKKHNDVFTLDGHVQGFMADQNEPLEKLLQKANVKTRDIAILMSLFKALFKFQTSKRPTAAEVLSIRAMREFS